ncbi:NAD(P)/FAD-dependent oxidoreductase [Pandoraea anhela]|uniref:Putidaredoxin reductase n=1 Tax=Pandoraea anhela TaxID=2508295 RepID=A0A5E4YRT0_9BURK|nr:Putidaredoxin reductase [Pandoraea anhela]
MTLQSVVVIGAGHAGVTCAATLRRLGYTGTLTLLDAQPETPYQRPQLSKAMLVGAEEPTLLPLRPPAFFDGNSLTWCPGDPAIHIDVRARRVHLASGKVLGYGKLVMATGSQPRKWTSGAGCSSYSALSLSTASDSRALRGALQNAAHLTVVGGGFIGLEVAAAARSLGVSVSVIERSHRILSRVASPAFAERVATLHRENGVDIRCNAEVVSITSIPAPKNPLRATMRLSCGEECVTDVCLAGIGSVARDSLAKDAGLVCEDGIVVDSRQVSSEPDILAIGDCARSFSARYQRYTRWESVQAAQEQARIAAMTLCCHPIPAPEAPWFWSDQFGIKMQMAGWLPAAVAAPQRCTVTSDSFSLKHFDGQKLLAVESWNDVSGHMDARMILTRDGAV